MATTKVPTKVLYVGNLALTTTAAQIAARFKKYGQVFSSRVCTTQGAPKAFGWVTLDASVADEALAAENGTQFLGRFFPVAPAYTIKSNIAEVPFWQSPDGTAIIRGAICRGNPDLGTWLKQFNPFKDLCDDVLGYILGVLNANCTPLLILKGAFMHAALNVYFTDVSLGGAKLKDVLTPFGSYTFNLTKMVTTSDIATVSQIAAMAGASLPTTPTVMQFLKAISHKSNAGGTVWYGGISGNGTSPTITRLIATFRMVNTNTMLFSPPPPASPPPPPARRR